MHQLTKFHTSLTFFGFGDPDFLADADILASGRHLPGFWATFNCACAETAISGISSSIHVS